MLELLMLIAGFILLMKGADFFVDACTRIAKRFGISDLIIGLTIVAMGTSIPELASSIAASIKGNPGLILGNVVGSNIANVGLIIGIAASLRSIVVPKTVYLRDAYIMVFSVVLFAFFVNDGIVSRFEAIILLALFMLYSLFLINIRDGSQNHRFRDFVKYCVHIKIGLKPLAAEVKKQHLEQTRVLIDVLIAVVSVGAIALGARFLIDGAVWMARVLNIPETIIGLTVIAVGTSLPELSVSLSAVKKRLGGILVGNIVGSNIANVLLIFGVASFIKPIPVSQISATITIPVMIFFTLGLTNLIKMGKLSRKSGTLLFSAYVIFMTLAVISGWA